MALTRGEKKVNLPISADFQRLGTQQKSTNIFNAAKQVIEPLMELEAAKQEIDMQLLENNSKERISTYNYALDKDRNIKRTLNALSDAEKKDLRQKKKDLMKAQKFGALGKLSSKMKEMGIGVKEGRSTKKVKAKDGSRTKVRGTGAAKKGFRKARLS